MSLETQPFVVKLGSVAVFPMTSVIYLELDAGQLQIESLHRSLSSDALHFEEPFPFHPHITLAQNFDKGCVKDMFQVAQEKWQSYTGPREFLLDRVVFVQNTANNCWIDLRALPLQGLPVSPVPVMVRQFIRTF